MRIDMSNGAIETIPNEKVLASIGDHIDTPHSRSTHAQAGCNGHARA